MSKNWTLLSVLPFFDGLSVEDRRALSQHIQVKDYPKKRVLFRTGDAAQRLYLLVEGRIRLYLEDATDHQTTLHVACRGDVIELIPLFESPSVHLVSAETVTPVTLVEISLDAAKSRIGAPSSFLNQMLKAVSSEMERYLETRKILSKPAAQRVAWLLLQQSRHMVGKGGSFSFPYDKGTAAAELCMSPETFSRCLSRLTKAGVTHRDNEICIENFERLRNFVQDGGNRVAAQRPKIRT